jgi:iron(III) transport system permease protein
MTVQGLQQRGITAAGLVRSGMRVDLLPAVVAIVAAAILAPICFLVYGALTTTAIGQPFGGLTLRNFATVMSEPAYLTALLNTLYVGFLSTVLATFIGALLAWIIIRTDTPGRSALRVGVMIPFFLSPFIGALAWTLLLQRDLGPLNLLFGAIGLPQVDPYSVKMIIFVMAIYYAPYVFIFVSSALLNIDPALEEAGHLSGLNRRQVLLRITMPLVAPAILSGMLLTFVATAGQFGVPALLGTKPRFFVLTTYMYQLLNRFPSQYNLAATLGLVMLAIACFGVWLQSRLMRGRSYVTVGGKGFRPRILQLGPLRWLAFSYVGAFILLGSALPMAMLLWVSLVPYYDATFSLSRLSLEHYRELLSGRLILPSLRNTIVLAVAASTIAVLLAVALNWMLLRTKSIWRKPLEFVLIIPAAIPHVVLGVGMLWTYIYAPVPIYGTIWILLIGYVTGFITQAVRNVQSSFLQIDRSLEEAVTMVGGSRLRVIREVTAPLLRPGLVGAWILLFIIYVRELSTSIFLYSPGNEVMSVLMFNMWGEGNWGGIAALAMVQMILVGSVVYLASAVFKVDLGKA